MIPDRAGNQDSISRLNARQAGQAVFLKADAGGVDVQPVTPAFFHHLGVSGHDFDACFLGRVSHAVADLLEIGNRVAFLENESAAEIKRRRTACRDIVHCAANGESTDISTWEKVRRNNEAIGGKCKLQVCGKRE